MTHFFLYISILIIWILLIEWYKILSYNLILYFWSTYVYINWQKNSLKLSSFVKFYAIYGLITKSITLQTSPSIKV